LKTDSFNRQVQKLIKDIKEPLKEIQDFQNQRINFINSRIEYVLLNKINNRNTIENILDELLDIAYWDFEIMKNSFYKLNEYYKKIDYNAAKCYEQDYIEIAEEEIDNYEEVFSKRNLKYMKAFYEEYKDDTVGNQDFYKDEGDEIYE